MKSKIKSTGEIVEVVSCSCKCGSSRDETDSVTIATENGYETLKYINYYLDLDLESGKEIDWEQRRFELAKAAMQGMLSNPTYDVYDNSFSDDNATLIASSSIKYADELIKQLKGSQQ